MTVLKGKGGGQESTETGGGQKPTEKGNGGGTPPGPAGSPPSNRIDVGKPKGGKLEVTLPDSGTLRIAAYAPRHKSGPKPKPDLKPVRITAGPGQIEVALKLTGAAKSILQQKGKLSFKVSITFTPAGGTAKTVTVTVTLKG